MRHFFSTVAGLCALALASPPAQAAAVFSSEPHILALGDRQQIVLFAGDPIDGAMATRRADGSWDVLVPNAGLDEGLLGRRFAGPPVGGEAQATQVALETTSDGDVRLRLHPAGEVSRVVAYGVGRPPRLMVDLLPAGADPKKRAAEQPKTKRKPPKQSEPKPSTGPQPVALEPALEAAAAPPEIALKAGSEKAPLAQAPPRPETSEDPEEHEQVQFADRDSSSRAEGALATRRPDLFASTDSEPGPIVSSRLRQDTSAVSTPHVVDGSVTQAEFASVRAVAEPEEALTERPEPIENVAVALGQDEFDGSGRVALALANLVDARDQHCLFTRTAGVPYCAPNGDAPGYAQESYSSGLAHRIAAGATWLAPVRSPSAAGLFLAADRDFILRARKGWLLSTVSSYERALRLEPDFPDAIRAHMNIALIYAVLGFAPELGVSASDKTNPARAFASALLGDRRLESGLFGEAAVLYERAATGGGMAACLAARGLAGLALAEGRTERAHAGLSSLRDLCPRGLVDDPDTERLRARIALALGDPDGALATLERVEGRLKHQERGAILRERATIAEGAGRLDVAGEAWASLETGRYGPMLEAEAAIALARLEGTQEAVDDGLSRLSDLPPDDRARARRELLIDVSGDALQSGDDLSAVAMILGEGLDPAGLAPREQVELAAAYRRLGLVPQAREMLERVEANNRGGLPETYWAERGAFALATGDLGAAEETLSRWQRSRGGNPSVGELELRAEVLAGRNAGTTAIEGVLSRLAGIDRRRAVATRWRVAAILADSDPVAGVALLEKDEQLAKLPDLPEKDLRDTLWRLGRAAEEAGQPALALAAYRPLGLGFPGTARGAEASYRAARLLEIEQEFPAARRAFDRAATHPQGIDRRLAEAASAYHGVVRPWDRPEEKL